MATAPPSIAATSTRAMVCAAETRGARTGDLLEAAGLSRDFLADPDARIPAPVVLTLWNALRERTADPALQLTAPTALPFGAYRVIDYLVAASTTVGEGIDRFATFFGLIADSIALTVSRGRREHFLSLATVDGRAVPPLYVDYVFAALVGRIRMRIRPALRLSRVELRQPEPEATAPYRDVFQAPVRFAASADRLCFSDEEWKAPMDTGDPALASLLEEHARILARRVPREAPGFTGQVQAALTSALPEGGSARDVARVLHVSVRTLQRKLVAAGTTFREVADTVRAHLAKGYLTDPSVSIAEVAFILGFADQSSFNRAFRRWTGEAPGRWRERQT
jgi:AraC-like DNA-binding protein